MRGLNDQTLAQIDIGSIKSNLIQDQIDFCSTYHIPPSNFGFKKFRSFLCETRKVDSEAGVYL